VSIRIWHHSFTVLSDLPQYDAALATHFARVSRPDTSIVLHGMQPGTYRAVYPGDDIKHVGLQYLHSLQFLAGAIRAEREGYDAFALSTLPEPALREIRALVSIPVVGYGEAAMRAAVRSAGRFGVLVFIPELTDLVVDNAARHGLGDRCVSVRDVGFRFEDVLAGMENPAPLIDRFRRAARGLIAAGAQAIIPGEAPLNVLLAAEGVTAVDGVPVIDSLGAWVLAAEDAVDRQRRGDSNPGEGYFNSVPGDGRRDEVLAFYGLTSLLREIEPAGYDR
jgi:allantoin racemase